MSKHKIVILPSLIIIGFLLVVCFVFFNHSTPDIDIKKEEITQMTKEKALEIAWKEYELVGGWEKDEDDRNNYTTKVEDLDWCWCIIIRLNPPEKKPGENKITTFSGGETTILIDKLTGEIVSLAITL